MSTGYEHGHHVTGRHVLRLSTVLGVIKSLRHREALGLESRLEGLEGWGVDGPLRYVRQRRAGGSLSGIGRLASVGWIEGLRVGGGCGSIRMSGDLLMEWLLFLLLGRIEGHGCW